MSRWQRGDPFSLESLPFVVLLIIFQYLLVIPHELGHAIAARLTGFSHIRILLGSGKPLFHFRALGFTWFINRIPAGGLAWADPPANVTRRQYVIYSASGLLVNAALLLLGLGLPRLFDLSSMENQLSAFVWANAIVIVENLIPYTAQTAFGRLPTDGKLLYNLIFRWGKPAQPPTEVSRSTSWTVRILKGIGVTFLVLCALALLAVAVVLAFILTSPFAIAAGIFVASLGVVLLWYAWRLFKEPFTASEPDPSPSPFAWYHNLRQKFPSSVPLPEQAPIEGWIEHKQNDHAIAACERLLLSHPGDPALLLFYALALTDTSPDRAASAWQLLRSKIPSEETEIHAALTLQQLTLLIRHADLPQFTAACGELLSLNIPPSQKIAALDQLACSVLYDDLSHSLPSAEYCIRRALDLAPGTLTLKGTLGALLAELGNFAEAEPLLRECHDRSPAPHDQGITGFYLAVIAARRHETKQSQALARKSLALYPQPWLLRKAGTLLHPVLANNASPTSSPVGPS